MKKKRYGLTIVELLIGISIMVILFAVLIPAVRLLSDDTRTYNGASMLASAISDAAATSVRATPTKRIDDSNRVEGNCVILERNPNFVDQDEIFFGVTKIRRGKVTLRIITQEPNEPGSGGNPHTEVVGVNLWPAYEPPITEGLAPGTEVLFEGQTATIVEFVFAT